MTPEPIELLLQAVEQQAALSRELLAALKRVHSHEEELGDSIVDLERRLTFIANRARLLFSMKAATLTTDCLRCGSTFATEPGPELCGPCWTELGRPERYLAPVPPIGA
jgi:hypothetical protein